MKTTVIRACPTRMIAICSLVNEDINVEGYQTNSVYLELLESIIQNLNR